MDDQTQSEFKNTIGPLRVLENEPLFKHTYFKIGGPARLFFEPKTVEDLKLALETAFTLKIPFIVLGGGANVLASDKGFGGLVIKNRASGIKIIGIKGTINKIGKGIKNVHVWVASGTPMNQFARFTIDQGLEGLEFLLSVPGTIGGGIKINAHFEVEKQEFLGSSLVSALLFNPQTGELKTVDQDYFGFDYDYSTIQDTGEIVLEAIFKLNQSPNPKDLWQRSMDNVKRRNEEQPVGIACSGCTFRNITKDDAMRINTPNLTTSTGYIIDSLGLKGAKIGGAEISNHHANFILNTNNASASDVLQLIKIAKEKAKQKYNLDLKEEIFYVGDF